MRKVLIVLGVITILSLIGAATGSGLTLPGTGSSPTPAARPGQSAATAPTGVATTAAAIATPTPPTTGPTPTPLPVSKLNTQHEALVLLNPSSARPGSTVGVTGSGFDPGATVDVYLKHKADDQGKALGFVQADKSGSFGGFNLTLPSDYVAGPFIVLVRQHNGGNQAMATGTVAANSPQVTFGTQVGKPGDTIAYSMKGFAPSEKVSIYFNSLSSPVLATVNTDQSGNVRQDSLSVPFGAIGNNAFIFVGQKSQSPVTVSFLMLNLYPVVSVNSYATKADTTLSFNGKGFGPNERVLLYLNSVQSAPIAITKADGQGTFKNGALFTIPFALKGKATFIAIGEQSQAPSTVSIDILPYTPVAETSTYGGRAGTTVTFYGTGFARQEVVHIYVGRTRNSTGSEVSCLMTDPQGNFGAVGSYTIESNQQAGQLLFTLVGDKSDVPTTAKMQVMAPGAGEPKPATTAAKPFKCPYGSSAQAAGAAPLPTPTPVPAPPAADTSGTAATDSGPADVGQ